MIIVDVENKIQLLDFTVLFICIFAGRLAGRSVMNHIANSIIGFNGPAIAVLAVGELIWNRVRYSLIKTLNNKKAKKEKYNDEWQTN